MQVYSLLDSDLERNSHQLPVKDTNAVVGYQYYVECGRISTVGLLWGFVGFAHFFRVFSCAENTKSKFSLLLQPIIHAIHLTSLLTNPSAL